MTRKAALAMYDPPELRAANDALWAAIAGRLRDRGVADAPHRLSRDEPYDATWRDPDLLLAQTCGYPLATALLGQVQVVATPRYAAPGCEGADYRSAVVVREGAAVEALSDLHGERCAINDLQSNSGMNLLRAAIAPLAGGAPFFRSVAVTGSHAESVRAVANGEADVAAIDCVTWALLQRHRRDLTDGLRVLAWTGANPGLPLITGAATSPRELGALRRALEEVAEDPALRPVLDALLIDGFSVLAADSYRAPAQLAVFAAGLGYAQLA